MYGTDGTLTKKVKLSPKLWGLKCSILNRTLVEHDGTL